MSTRRLVRRNGIREEPAGSAGSRVRELVTQTQKPLGPEWGSTVGQGTGQSEARSHPRDIIPGRHTGFPSCRKVAENPEGIPSTALVRVDPVYSPVEWGGGSGPPRSWTQDALCPTSLPLLQPAAPTYALRHPVLRSPARPPEHSSGFPHHLMPRPALPPLPPAAPPGSQMEGVGALTPSRWSSVWL